jgi:EmrB/QacA subfamily drug resistance transporter
VFVQDEQRSQINPAAPPNPLRWWILFVILAAEVMDLLDGTIVNVAAPSIRGDLGATLTQLQWVTGGYALAFAVGLVTGARLGDIFGRRQMFLLGVAGFTLSSAACGLATSPEMLIGCRLVQGLFAASMIPQGFGIVRQVFPPSEVGKAFGMFGPVIGGSAILGPIVGGLLVDANLGGEGWRTIFLVNVPLGIVAFVAGWRLLPESRAPRRPSLDVLGAILASAAAGLLIYPLIQGNDAGWPAWTYASMLGSAAVLALFVVHERRRERAGRDPLVTMTVFRRRSYSAGVGGVTLMFGAVIGLMFIFSLYLQMGLRYSAVSTGLALGPWALGTAIGAGTSGGFLTPKIGRHALHLGLALLAVAVGAMLVVVHGGHGTSVGPFVAPLFVAGLGMGVVVAPLFRFILAGVADDEVGSASGVLNAMQQLGGAAGIAALGNVFFHHGLEKALWVELALLAACAALVLFLPQTAPDEGDVHGAAEPA